METLRKKCLRLMAPKHLCFSSLRPYEIKTESQTKTFEAAFTQNVAVLHIFGVVMNVILAIIHWSVVNFFRNP